MRGPTREELQKTSPPALRTGSKTTQAYLDMRSKILAGEYTANQVIIPKQIEEAYHVNNTTTQVLLARLANEGLVRVLPIKERTWPYNASLNEYRVVDLTHAQKALLIRQDALHPDVPRDEQVVEREILLPKIQYADVEIAQLLALPAGDKVVAYRELQRRADKTVVAISDIFLPFWFAEVLPELEQRDSDIYQLMRQAGKFPAKCTETVEVVQASSIERLLFELSPDDPAPLLKLQQHIFDREEKPLAVQFLTIKGDQYRLQYSFPLALSDTPDI
jgi:DNA-binding GntR family transcriptional regulator